MTDYIFIKTDFFLETNVDFADLNLKSTKLVVLKPVVEQLEQNETEKSKKILEDFTRYKDLQFFIFDEDDYGWYKESSNTIFADGIKSDYKFFFYISRYRCGWEHKYLATFNSDLLNKYYLSFLECKEFREEKIISSSVAELFVSSLNSQDIFAQSLLGDCYLYGFGKDIEKDEAFKCFDNPAQKDVINAQYKIWHCFTLVAGVNKETNVEQITKAAEQGFAAAQYDLGLYYYYVDKKTKKLLYWFNKASEQNHTQAQVELANYYAETKEYDKALIYIQKAADLDNSIAQYKLGLCYSNGQGVKQDYHQAVEWFTKAAEQGLKEAQYKLATCYENRQGVERDVHQAVEWFTKAAEQGLKEAQYKLACCYEYAIGIDKNYEAAVKWYKEAALQGHKEANFELAFCYEIGQGVQKNLNEACKWYEKAALQNHVEAQYKLALLYENGQGIDQNPREAFEWFTKAAEQNYTEAQYKLAICYENGRGVQQNFQDAFKWYKKAAEQNHEWALYKLGICYEEGFGIAKNYKEAFECYQKSASFRNNKALYKLGVCYEKGQGVDRNYPKALDLYRKASDLGHLEARERLNNTIKKNIEEIIKELNADLIDGEHIRAKRWYITCIVVMASLFSGFVAYMWWNVTSISHIDNCYWEEILIRILISMSFLSTIFIMMNQAARARKNMVLLSREIQEFKYIGALLKGKVDMSTDSLKTNKDIDDTFTKMIELHLEMQKQRLEKEDHSEVKDITPDVLNFYKDHTTNLMNNYNDLQKTIIGNLKNILEVSNSNKNNENK